MSKTHQIKPDPCQRLVIQRARQAKGLTQRELAQQLGMSAATISKLENGRLALDPASAARLAAVLDVQGEALSQLLGHAGTDDWRRWIWQSPCTPNEKLLLLALLDNPASMIDTDTLIAKTGLPLGSLRALTDGLHRRGVLRRVMHSKTGELGWRLACRAGEAA